MKGGFKPRAVWSKPQAGLYDTRKETSDFSSGKRVGKGGRQGKAENVSFWRAGLDLRPQPWNLAPIPSRQPDGRAWTSISVTSSGLPEQPCLQTSQKWASLVAQQSKRTPANAGDTSSMPDPRRCHMPWSNYWTWAPKPQSQSCWAHAPQLPCPHAQEPVPKCHSSHARVPEHRNSRAGPACHDWRKACMAVKIEHSQK